MVYGEKVVKMISFVWMVGGLFFLFCFCYYKYFGYFFLKEKLFFGFEKLIVKGL